MMKIRTLAAALLSVVVCSLTSCLGDTNTTDYSTYDDVAITSVSLGKVNRYIHYTSSAGTDSVVKTSFTASSLYPMNVDQVNHTIYNTDSLPTGTDTKHVLVTFSSKNSGIVTIKSLTSDTVTTVSSTDSLDFSQPRDIYVYSYNGMNMRRYTMQLNVHQEDADSFKWYASQNIDILKNYKSVKVEDNTLSDAESTNNIFLLASDDTKSDLFLTTLNNNGINADLRKVDGMTLSPKAQMVDANGLNNSSIYVLDSSMLYALDTEAGKSSKDASDITSLLGVVENKLYAVSKTKGIVSTEDNGASWVVESFNGKAEYLPAQNISNVTATLYKDDTYARMTVVGNRSVTEYPEDTVAVVWSKLFSINNDDEEDFIYQPWAYDDIYKLPNLKNLSATLYDDLLIAIGGYGENNTYADNFYVSADHGITWQTDDSFTLPNGFVSSGASIFAYGNNIWLVCAGSGQVWKGHLNSVGWQEQQKVFYSKLKIKNGSVPYFD